MRATSALFLLFPALASASPLGVGSAVVFPIYDNTVYSESGALSNGAGQYVFAGRNSLGNARRALLLFDPALSVPAGATIVTARLELEMSMTSATAADVAVHRATSTWGEGGSIGPSGEGGGGPATTGSATWRYRFFPTTPWSTSGGDFLPEPSAVTLVGGVGSYAFGSTPGLVADVQAWIDTPASNAGWFLVGDESLTPSVKRFGSRSSPTPPRLVITFTPPAPGASLCEPGSSGVRACPCANPPGGPGRGCDNSSASGGAALAASGVASLGADTVVLATSGELPTSLSIVLQGDALVAGGAPFGEGVRCAGGALRRLHAEHAVGGGIVHPDGGEPALSASSAALGDPIAPGSSRWYQVYYRDPFLPCAGEPNFNATQALRIDWSL